MTASKEELKNAFEAGRRSPNYGGGFDAYWEVVQEGRKLNRQQKELRKRERAAYLRDEARRRSAVNFKD